MGARKTPPVGNPTGIARPDAGGWAGISARLRRHISPLHDALERGLGKNTVWAVVFVVLLTPILSQKECGLSVPTYEVGEVASGNIQAPHDIDLVDEKATLGRREEEKQRVRPVYDFVVGLHGEEEKRILEVFEKGREAVGSSASSGAEPGEDAVARVKSAVELQVADEVVRALLLRGFSTEAQEAGLAAFSSVTQGKIVATKEGLPAGGSVAVREVRPGLMFESTFNRLEQIRDLEEARTLLGRRIGVELPEWSEKERRALTTLLGRFVLPNFTYNASETERRRDKAVASVPQVFTRIARGRVIVRDGEVFTQEALDLLSRIRSESQRAVDWKALAGNAMVLSLLALFTFRYVSAHQRLFRRVKNLYTMALLVGVFMTVGTWVGAFVADSVADQFFVAPFNEPSAYYWALPISSGAMLMTLLANGRVATVCSAMIAVLFGMALGWDAKAILFALLSSFAAIYGISKYQQRTSVIRSGLFVGLVNVAIVFALHSIEDNLTPASNVLLAMAAAGAGGILAALIASFSLPILEWLFNALTDIRLLELSNLDNPLLRRLSMEAPGTYSHSVIVGTLAEQAAEKVIGAHALFCRVAPYYHDIGKIAKPGYFVENMQDGLNRHDRLSPRMSSLIIASHVKEGLRLAEEFNLPRRVRDVIPQHHGTRLITFFYRKAKKKEDPDVREIHESDYRYPGPKPQTKEAAIIMMADAVEAAARSVEEPTPAKFEEVIRTISNAIILDNQLDECDLTFSDLAKIGESFLKTLTAVHHHRIAYPGYEFDRARPRAVEAE